MNARTPSRVHRQWVIVYDGECNFCRRQIALIRARDRENLFELLPRQAPGLIDRFPMLAQGDFNTGMRLINPAGRIYVGADSVYQIARLLPRLRWFAWMYRVPGLHALFRVAYAWVAAHRQSLGQTCRDDSCANPSSSE